MMRILGILIAVAGMAMASPSAAQPPEQADGGANPVELREGILVPVPLPITSAAADQVRQSLEQALAAVEGTADAGRRPIAILEFDTRNSTTGEGSDFHSALSLAEFLTSTRMNRLRTVAYIPAPRGLAAGSDPLDQRPISHLQGHAVLVALACSELAMHEEAAIGQAGIDETVISNMRQVAYEEIASKRLVLPMPLAISLLDSQRSVFRADTPDGILYVDRAELERLQQEGKVIAFETLTEEGSSPLLTSRELSTYRLIQHRVDSRRQLASRFDLNPNTLEVDPALGKDWRAVQLNVTGYVDHRDVSWFIRAMNQQIDGYNLVIVRIDAEGGDPFECLRLADYLASFDSTKIRTVAYIPERAGGASSLIALACDHVMMSGGAMLGGPLRSPLEGDALEDFSRGLRPVANHVAHPHSVLLAMVDPGLELIRARNTRNGLLALMSEEELQQRDDRDDWVSLGRLQLSEGISGNEALQYQLARMLVNDYQQLKAYYQLKEEPHQLQPSLTDRWIESLAQTLASPWIAGWLLFGAMFLLSSELSQPGVGIPGFLGSMCLILFFWSQYLDGNVHWLEIILLVAGITFIVLEIFVLPGFGIFGIGGLLMVVSSIVLATQTFIIPRNSEEFQQLPVSLAMVLAAFSGFFASMFIFRRYLVNTRLFRRLVLDPNVEDDVMEPLAQRESVTSRDHLMGQQGVAVTRLAPTGKARIGSDIVDVITEGRVVERNDPVRVTEVIGNRVVVAPLEAEPL